MLVYNMTRKKRKTMEIDEHESKRLAVAVDLTQMPLEMWEHMLFFMDLVSIAVFSATCKGLYEIANNGRFWPQVVLHAPDMSPRQQYSQYSIPLRKVPMSDRSILMNKEPGWVMKCADYECSVSTTSDPRVFMTLPAPALFASLDGEWATRTGGNYDTTHAVRKKLGSCKGGDETAVMIARVDGKYYRGYTQDKCPAVYLYECLGGLSMAEAKRLMILRHTRVQRISNTVLCAVMDGVPLFAMRYKLSYENTPQYRDASCAIYDAEDVPEVLSAAALCAWPGRTDEIESRLQCYKHTATFIKKHELGGFYETALQAIQLYEKYCETLNTLKKEIEQ